MSDVEGAGDLEEYLSHVKRESRISVIDPGTPDGDLASPHNDFMPSPAVSRRPMLSRPPSIAASLTSADGLNQSSNKISAAAFRKGMRRSSEAPVTMSDIGHGGREDDDDDDIPLGRPSCGFRETRAHSSASLVRLHQDREDIPLRISPQQPSPTPGQSTAFTLRRHNRNEGGSGGFVVKSAKSTRTVPSPSQLEIAASGVARPVSFIFPAPTSPPSPALPDSQEVIKSPIAMSANDGYFSLRAPLISSVPPKPLASSAVVKPKSDLAKPTLPFTSPPATAGRTPPPVAPLSLPQPGEESPASLDLPLPPDQMPDSPTQLAKDPQSNRPIGPISPSRGRKVSLLDEPLKMLSGLWPTSPSAEVESFDAAMVVDSMKILGEGDESAPPPIDKDLRKPPSRATLFDASAASSDENGRPPLEVRLANAASGLSRPSIARLKIGDNESADGHATECLRSQPSDSGTASPISSTGPSIPSSFARMTELGPTASNGVREGRRQRKDWSSSESEDEAEARQQRSSRRRMLGGPRMQSTRRRVVPGSGSLSRAKSPSESPKESSSDNESLAAVRVKASRSSASLASMANPPSDIPPLPSSSSSLHAKPSGRPALGPVIGVPPRSQRRQSSQSRDLDITSFRRSRSPGLALDRLSDLSAPGMVKRPTASPASSQSGVTSESLGPHPMTPREASLGLQSNSRDTRAVGHSRDSSMDLDSMFSQPVSADDRLRNASDSKQWSASTEPKRSPHGTFDARPRRASLGRLSQPQPQPSPHPPFDPIIMPMPVPQMDTNAR